MVEQFKLEDFDIRTHEIKLIVGFSLDITCEILLNGKSFTCKVCYDARVDNPKKDLKKRFYKGEIIKTKFDDKDVTIQLKDGWVYVTEA